MKGNKKPNKKGGNAIKTEIQKGEKERIKKKKSYKKVLMLCLAHALWTSGVSKYAPRNRPLMNLLSLLYEFSYSSFKFFPLNCGILHKYAG
jgi:hypothetical protein